MKQFLFFTFTASVALLAIPSSLRADEPQREALVHQVEIGRCFVFPEVNPSAYRPHFAYAGTRYWWISLRYGYQVRKTIKVFFRRGIHDRSPEEREIIAVENQFLGPLRSSYERDHRSETIEGLPAGYVDTLKRDIQSQVDQFRAENSAFVCR